VREWLLAGCAVALALSGAPATVSHFHGFFSIPNLTPFSDLSGEFRTYSTAGAIDTTTHFFKTSAQTGDAASLAISQAMRGRSRLRTPSKRFDTADDTDPIFRPLDGATGTTEDVSTTEARCKAYTLLLRKGLIRIGIEAPYGADFQVIDVDNPYSKVARDKTDLSMYRRPLPATNLGFLSALTFDGRESIKDPQTGLLDLVASPKHQAMDATTDHAQGVAPTDEQLYAEC
jgi:cytochrome c peroxidase